MYGRGKETSYRYNDLVLDAELLDRDGWKTYTEELLIND